MQVLEDYHNAAVSKWEIEKKSSRLAVESMQ